MNIENKLFLESIVHYIPGFLSDYTALRTMNLLDWQEREGINGSILEIGVFSGRYFSLMLRSALRSDNVIIGIDTFEHVDQKHLKFTLSKIAPLTGKVIFLKGASVEFQADELKSILGPCRFISVDGSHELNDVFWDLRLCEELLGPHGIVAVDDFLNPVALGVNEAVNLFFAQPRSLVPIAYICNKLFLARPTTALRAKDKFEEFIRSDNPPDGDNFRWPHFRGRNHLEQKLWGHPLLVVP